MDDLERQLEEVGRDIAPDLGAARSAVAARAGGRATRLPRPRFGGSALAAAGVALVMAAALGVTVTLRHSGTPGAPAAGAAGPVGPAVSATDTGAGSSTMETTVAGSTTATATSVTVTLGSGSVVTTATITHSGTFPPVSTTTAQATSAASSGGVVMVTDTTHGPLQVQRGQEVEVDLAGSSEAWSEPQSSDSSVLVRLSGSTGSDGSAHALFRAVSDGSATLFAAQAPPPCYPRCLPPQKAMDVAVTVSG